MSRSFADAPDVLRRFLTYVETIQGKSPRTAEEYYLDLRLFLRYLKRQRGLVPPETELAEIDIRDVGAALLKTVTLMDLYDYMSYLSRERTENHHGEKTGIGSAARARKAVSLRMFFKYLTKQEMLLDDNPAAMLETAKIKKALPRHLTEEESVALLTNVDGENAARDFCILTLFLNCGLRVSELCGINVQDLRDNGTLVVTGKGNKQRTVYLNDACRAAVEAYLPERAKHAAPAERALFVTRRKTRISAMTVKWLVKKRLGEAGLDTDQYSAHKLRHTAATLMYQNGVDVLALKEILGHEQLNTTQIYTHVNSDILRKAAESNPLSSFRPSARQKDGGQSAEKPNEKTIKIGGNDEEEA